jgi:hypothetical protein
MPRTVGAPEIFIEPVLPNTSKDTMVTRDRAVPDSDPLTGFPTNDDLAVLKTTDLDSTLGPELF